MQAGGGGAELEEFAPTRNWFTAKVLRDYQYCLITLAGSTLRMTVYNADGELCDYLDLKK